MGVSGHSEKEVEVRWAVSGNIACSIMLIPQMCIAEIKALVHDKVGIPTEEQHVFVEGQEFLGESVVDTGPDECSLTLLRTLSDPCTTNLSKFRTSLDGFEPLPRGQFTVIRKLASGIHGDILQCCWKRDDSALQYVAVKKLRNNSLARLEDTETNERTIHMESWAKQPHSEDALSEIGVLMHLCQQDDLSPYIVRMLGVYLDDGFTWLVSELAEGGDLFEMVASQRLGETKVQRFTWQLLQALAHLHGNKIGHRDISLENILLKDGVAKVTDFGMAVQSSSASGVPLRYFRGVGKDNYRAPEVYVPRVPRIGVTTPPTLTPNRVAMIETRNRHFCEVRFPEEAQAGQPCMADVWGYSVEPADVFSSGVCLFTMSFNCPPWQRAQLADTCFSWVRSRGDAGINCLIQRWKKHPLGPEPTKLLAEMLRPVPTQRPSAAECLRSAWFVAMDSAEAT